MSGLQNFVKGNRNGRAGSPQNGQPSVNPQRQIVAANARVQMKPNVARPPTAQGLYVRGDSIAQHQVASVQQQPLQQRPSDEGRKRDPWETDTGSIDTTVNQSIVQIDNTPQLDQKQSQSDSEESERGDEDASGEEELEDEEEPEIDQTVDEYLTQHNMADATHGERMQFLRETQPQLFPTIDGDSYPTTTDGNPTEWDEQQEPRFEDLGPPSPSPQSLSEQGLNASFFNQQPLHGNLASNTPHANPGTVQNTKIWHQGAQIRGQQRINDDINTHGQYSQKRNTAHPPTSQPPAYSQAPGEHRSTAPPATHAQPGVITQWGQDNFSQRSSRLPQGPGHTHNPVLKITKPIPPSKHASTTRVKVVPIIQQYVEPAPLEEPPACPDGDYDPETLSKMEYDQLRDESFDKTPRGREHVLPEHIREKPLPERLHFAQKHLGPAAQSEFFSALPTNQWEDAGDWFLDQFSAIIKRTREARQKKRRAALDLEGEIEVRHIHVAKKICLVEGAMAKMKAQGEGLVPKSPRAAKSPRPGRS